MLSVIVIAKNEAANIRRCLESVSWADEIIVLDSGSTDATVAIAQEFTDKVYQTDWPGYGVQKDKALSFASCEWVLNLDADEYLDLSLQQEIKTAMFANKADAFRIPIRMVFNGKPLRYSSSPKRHIRLFKRKGAKFSHDIVHEKIILPKDARIAKLKNPIRHHSFSDLAHALHKLNRYSSYTAKIRLENQKSASFSKTLLSTLWMFLRCYVLQRGFLDGREGLLFAVLNAQGTYYRGMKQLYRDVGTL